MRISSLHTKALSISIAVIALCSFASAQFGAQQSSGPLVSQVPPDVATVAIGKSAPVNLIFSINRGYHINSNTPKSELLVPTSLKLSPPSELMIGKITYPAGEDKAFPFSPDEKLNVYTGDFTVSLLVRAPQAASTGTFRVHGELKYQACTDRQCFPPKTTPVYLDVKLVKAARVHK